MVENRQKSRKKALKKDNMPKMRVQKQDSGSQKMPGSRIWLKNEGNED